MASMFGTHDLWLFIISGLVLNVTPGPDNIYIAARSLQQGWRAGMVASLGIGCGVFVHVLAAALGLAALLAASAMAFLVVKLVGAAYLLWLGIGLLRARESTPGAPETRLSLPLWRIFRQGFITNVLNPKVALFFLAFVPQFISHDAPSKMLAFIFLGVLFDVNSMLWCAVLAWLSAKAGHRLRQSQGWSRWLNRTVGGMFVLLGIRLAVIEQGG
jgi:RhtB (resistance to homoserine/threonine) family protein